MESLRTSSRPQFQVLGFSLKACKSSKMSCPRLEDSIIFWLVKKENYLTKNNTLFYSAYLFPFFIWKIIQCDSQIRQVIIKLILNGIVWKLLLIREQGDKTFCKKFWFLFLLILPVQAVQKAKHYSKAIQSHNKESGVPDKPFWVANAATWPCPICAWVSNNVCLW